MTTFLVVSLHEDVIPRSTPNTHSTGEAIFKEHTKVLYFLFSVVYVLEINSLISAVICAGPSGSVASSVAYR